MVRNILKKPSQIAALLAAVGITSDTSIAEGTGVGAAPGPGFVQKTITFTNSPVVLVDHAATVAYGSLKFFTFEKGQINIVGAVANLVVTKTSAGVVDAWNGDFGVGSVAADNSATLASTEQNVIPTTATPAATGTGSGAGGAHTTAKGKLTTAALLDGSVTAVDLYLNMLVDDANQDVTTTPCNLIVNGTITLTYANNGAA